MIELLKPFTSARAFVNAVSSWGAPLAVALAIYVICVFPSIQQTAVARAGATALRHDGIRPWWLLIVILVVLTVGLSASSRWIYQVLEGIRWPSSIRVRREKTHSLQWAVLDAERKVDEAESRLDYADHELAFWQERLDSITEAQERVSAESQITTCVAERDSAEQHVKQTRQALASTQADRRSRPHAWLRRDRPPLSVLSSANAYPARSEWIRATRFGNRIRAFETDGVARYQLDPLALWYELLVTAPTSLAANLQAARQGVEMWVGTWSAAILLGAASVVTEILGATSSRGGGLITPVVIAFVGWIAATVAYRAATAATDEWGYAVNALVNLGRGPLARAYGLKIPASIAEEKLMWEALRGYELYGTEPYANRLDEFRTQPDGTTTEATSEESSDNAAG